MFRERLKELIDSKWPGHLWSVSTPPDTRLGDYTVNVAFPLAKLEHRTVLEVAKEVADFLTEHPNLRDRIEKADVVAPGFVNIFLKDSFLRSELIIIDDLGEQYGRSPQGEGKKVIVEYSAPNIAKPMHVGHLRSTVIGDALANVYDALGYDVVRWNYLGDWGTSFGKLIAKHKSDLKEIGSEKMRQLMAKDAMGTMVAEYVEFTKEAENNPQLDEIAREEFKKLEDGDKENRELWKRFRELSLQAFERMYERLNVGLVGKDVVNRGESDYEDSLGSLVQSLQDKGLAIEGELGALVIDLTEYDISTPGMVRKSDGATVYLTRDIASLQDRLTMEPSAILYVVANQQALHLEQLFAVAEKMKQKNMLGSEPLPQLTHVKYGLVLGSDGKKFSTREGTAVLLENVLDEAERRSTSVVREKNPDLGPERVNDIARVVALGALKYNDLRQHPHSDITFDWDAMLDLTGNSGPYLQYTHARLNSIRTKAGEHGQGDVTLLEEADERLLLRRLLDYPDAVADAARLSALNGLALYLYELAAQVNRYYEHTRILEDENIARKEARLTLVKNVAGVLRRGLALLGIQAPERI